jgi:hypothetical protein
VVKDNDFDWLALDPIISYSKFYVVVFSAYGSIALMQQVFFMKIRIQAQLIRLAIIISIVFGLTDAHNCCAQRSINWQALAGEVQFGVTTSVGGSPMQSPSEFETGYHGAWVFGNSIYYGIGETFSVPSSGTLKSIELRLGGVNGQPTSGQFEVAIYNFNSSSPSLSPILGSVFGDAHDYYGIDLTQVPVSSFDFASLNISLQAGKTFGLAVTPTSTYSGGPLSLQAAVDIYPGGSPFLLSVVPEPNVMTLCGLGTVLALFMIWPRAKQKCRY